MFSTEQAGKVPQQLTLDDAFRIELPAFEGPLDLLLHLIQKHELDIVDLPISFVTEKYLDYLGMMKHLNLDVASEYLVMAAELARIKSKMLLPPSPAEQEEHVEDEIDPRAELIRRLLEYQKYKRAAEQLIARPVEGRDVFRRGVPAPVPEGPAPLAEIGLFKLLDAFQRVLARTSASLAFEISAERITIQERMTQITDLFRTRGVLTRADGVPTLEFEELFEGEVARYDIVVTFLALLEMAKSRLIRVYQTDASSTIHLELRLLADDPKESAAEMAASPPDPYDLETVDENSEVTPPEAGTSS